MEKCSVCQEQTHRSNIALRGVNRYAVDNKGSMMMICSECVPKEIKLVTK